MASRQAAVVAGTGDAGYNAAATRGTIATLATQSLSGEVGSSVFATRLSQQRPGGRLQYQDFWRLDDEGR
jgi:hypothetical protein